MVIQNCVAFKNGYVLDENGQEVDAGNGNGFKMGGSSISGHHILRNSVSFGNKAKGIDSNSCPDIEAYSSTSYNNESFNVAFYTNDAKNTAFIAKGILSFKDSSNAAGQTVAEQFKPKGTQETSAYENAMNYYWRGKNSTNSEGIAATAEWFQNMDMNSAIHGGIRRNTDGTINMNGFLAVTSAVPAGVGARMTGTPSAVFTVAADVVNNDDDDDDDNSGSSAAPAVDWTDVSNSVQDKVADKIFMIPRIYTNKPRTIGMGYKGMLHQPDPEKKEDMLKGIIAIRDLHTRAVNETGFTCADEMLYPENHRYLSDLLSYVAIGARSVEDQQHRLTASGVGIPAGMKNPTGGDISVMMNSIIAAQHGHMFLYRGWEVKTPGNPYAHAILRGYVDKFGRNMPNYHYEDLQNLLEHYQEVNESAQTKLVNPAVIIDTNHSNSGKRFAEQIRISKDVMHSCKVSEDVHKLVKGLMIESYIEDGAQKVSEHCYGKSITDPCLGWEKTEKLIYELAELW